MSAQTGARVENEREEASEGPRSRLAQLYIRHVPGARVTAYLLIGDRELAEDIAQEAFIRLARRFRHLRSPEAFHAYLRRTVVNLSFNHLRRQRVERSYLEAARGDATPTVAPAAEIGDRDELWNAIRALPTRQRAAVVLRYYEDLPERQVAEILQCSVPAARQLVARALDTLRSSIRKGDFDD